MQNVEVLLPGKPVAVAEKIGQMVIYWLLQNKGMEATWELIGDALKISFMLEDDADSRMFAAFVGSLAMQEAKKLGFSTH